MEYPLHKTVAVVDGRETYPEIVCTCGNDKYTKKPCVGGYMYDHFTGRPNPWKQHMVTKHQVVHFAWYHEVPRIGQDGKQAIFQDKPQFNKERCTGEGCKNCAANHSRVFGRLMKITLGTNHTKNLMGIRRDLYWTCSGCATQIVTKELICEGCEKVLVDLRNVKPDSDPESQKNVLASVRRKIETAINQEYTCSCGHVGAPVEGNDCGYNAACTIRNKKHKCPYEAPVRMDLYTSVLDIAKEGEKTDSRIVMKAAYSIFENSDKPYQFEVDEELGLIVNRAVEMNGGLYNLEKEVRDMMIPPDMQATVLGVPNPFANGPRIPGGEEDAPKPKFVGGPGGVVFPK